MKTSHFSARASLWLAAAGCVAAFGDEPLPAVPKTEETKAPSRWTFSLMPKSLQRKPSLDFHVITEMTEAGRKLKPPTAERPDYYLEQPGKFTQLGNNNPANEHPPAVADLERVMQKSLAAGNYLRATPATPIPRYVVVFNYGSFARFSTDFDDFQQMVTMEQVAPDAAPFIPAGGERDASALLPLILQNPKERMDILQRAELIGGEKFAHELSAVIEKEATFEQSSAGLDLGATPAEDMTSPFNTFMRDNEKLMDLVEESFSSCYFVIASAYDYPAMSKGKKVLLWRTKMTVNSIGISMNESLSPLIGVAGPYFGRDMTDAVTISKRISRDGRVEIGTPTVVDDNAADPAPPPAPTKNPAPAKP